MGLNLLSKEQVNAKDLMNTDLGHDSLENLDRISHGSVIVKPKSISVKGKKDFARSRAPHTNSSQIGHTKEIKNTNSEWTLSICMIQADKNGGFKFGSNSGNEMGDQCGRRDSGDSASDHRGNKSTPHSHHGVVRSKAPTGMEDGVSIDVDKFNAGLSPSNRPSLGKNGKPVVEVSVKHAGAGGKKNLGLESHSLNINEPSVMRDDTAGEFDHEEDDGEPSHSNGFYGKSACNKVTASLPAYHGVQHSLNSHGENDGCARALCDIDARQRPDDGNGTDDQMEFDGGSKITCSV